MFSPPQWTLLLPLLLPIYIILCSALRFQRRDAMHAKFKFRDRQSLSRMTNTEAQGIITYLLELEFPKIYFTSVQFALFKTYGIPTISRLLVATNQFSTPENASKRYADTSILISEFTSHPPRSERVFKAISRMNYIHARYQKAGKISQDDLLYTLSVFITEPVSWVGKYEWRDMTDMEKCAIATFWKSIGDAMGIDYNKQELSPKDWKDGLDFFEDISSWAENYEKKYMVPAETNKQTADELVPLLLFYVPTRMKAAAKNLVGVLMGDRLRASMMYPKPPIFSFLFMNLVLQTRRFVLRYLALPRPDFMRVRHVIDEPDTKTGRYHAPNYLAHPYYNRPGFLNRWGPESWLVWISGGDVPGSKGDLYFPQGYHIEEIGPNALRSKGKTEMQAWEERLSVERPAGCPFAFRG